MKKFLIILIVLFSFEISYAFGPPWGGDCVEGCSFTGPMDVEDLTADTIYANESIDFDLLSNSGSFNRANMVVDLARVNEGAGITMGKAVYVNGVTGDKPQVGLADNTLHLKAHVFGIALDTGADGELIRVQTFGELKGVDTSGFGTTGILHLSTGGNLLRAVPTSGAHIHVGWATKLNANDGIIEVEIDQYIHDLRATSDIDLKIATGDDASTYNIIIENYSGTDLGIINGNGLFTWLGDFLFSGSGSGLAYGEIYAEDNAVESTVALQNTWYKITIFNTDGEANNTTPSHSEDYITITNAGKYFTTVSASAQTVGAGARTIEVEAMCNLGEGGVADSVNAGGDYITDSDNTFSDSDLIEISGTECGIDTNTLYTICGLADNGAGTFQLDETLGCGGDCTVCDSALDITACTPAQSIEVVIRHKNVHADRKLAGGAGDLGSMSLSGIMDIPAGGEIEVWFKNKTGAEEMTIEDITLSVVQIGG